MTSKAHQRGMEDAAAFARVSTTTEMLLATRDASKVPVTGLIDALGIQCALAYLGVTPRKGDSTDRYERAFSNYADAWRQRVRDAVAQRL